MNSINKSNDAIWEAIVQDDIEKVNNLLKTDQNLASKNFDPGSLHSNRFPIVQACKNGNLEMLKVLIEAGADPNADTHIDPTAVEKSNQRHEFGMPLIHAMDAGRFDIVNFLLDNGASVDAHPNCDKDFATRVYNAATVAGAPANMILQGFAFLNDEEKATYELKLDENTPEVVKLFQRVLKLGAKPRVMAITRNQHYNALEAVLRSDPGGESSPGDWLGNTNHEAILYGAAWNGDPKAMEMCFEICGDRHTKYAAAFCINRAIRSHNRDGNYADYRHIINLNLDYLQDHNLIQEAQDEFEWFTPFTSLAAHFIQDNNYDHRCNVPNTMDDLLDLAQLLTEYRMDVNESSQNSGKTPLSISIEKGYERYVVFLKEHAGNTHE